jgi:hypothetical protein
VPINVNLDLSKLGRIPGAKTLGKAMNAAGTAWDRADQAFDTAGAPIRTARVRACTLECDAELTGMADVPGLGGERGPGYDVLLLRLRVARHGGPVECCVRQTVPKEHKRELAPGAQLKVLAHESNPEIAIVKWAESFQAIGDVPQPMGEVHQYAWPDRDEWPGEGAIEIRDDWLFRRKLEERRATWSLAGARLIGAEETGTRTNDRAEWKLDLRLDDGREVRVKQQVPALVLSRLVQYIYADSPLAEALDMFEIRIFVGAPIAVLVSPKGEVAVDWEATMLYPEMRNPAPL